MSASSCQRSAARPSAAAAGERLEGAAGRRADALGRDLLPARGDSEGALEPARARALAREAPEATGAKRQQFAATTGWAAERLRGWRHAVFA